MSFHTLQIQIILFRFVITQTSQVFLFKPLQINVALRDLNHYIELISLYLLCHKVLRFTFTQAFVQVIVNIHLDAEYDLSGAS